MGKRLLSVLPAVLLVAAMTSTILGGVTVYEEGVKKIEIGARIQLQYKMTDPDGERSSDELFFRRLRPYIQGSVTENWMAKLQLDFGKAGDDDEVAVKDAYLRYGSDGIKVTIGNAKHAFSREFLASSKRQQLVERSFVGDHNFGTPDRVLGVKVDGNTESNKLTYVAGVAMASHDPGVAFMDFDTPANNQDDWNEGTMLSGRIDFHPLGHVSYDQGDFGSDEWKFTVGGGFFTWSNDDDNNTYTDAMGDSLDPGKADLDSADGLEISGGVRGLGFSADFEYQMISGDAVVTDFTGGIYVNGEADVDKVALEAGYMVADKLEVVAGWDSFDADSYAGPYTRTSVGLNYFVNKHELKFQATYQMSENVAGVRGADSDIAFVQAQFVF